MISALERCISWVDSAGRPVDSTVLSGSGSPEGVVTANPKVLYMDENGTAGNILYVKKSGVGNTGWILV